MDTHLDVSLQLDAKSTLRKCGLSHLAKKVVIESVRIEGGISRGRTRNINQHSRIVIPDEEIVEVFQSKTNAVEDDRSEKLELGPLLRDFSHISG